ncbi:MAG TPA: NfeD family protein [Acidimicrobiales bacterium]|nr:NfeD family protein [Acidimicrobiales bacterium]
MDAESWRWVWLALAVGGVVGEIASAGTFFLLPFGVGAAAAAVLAFASIAVGVQWLAFVLISLAAFLATRPLARRLDASGPSGVGADRWVGQTGIVLREIEPHEAGLVRIGGDEWRALSRDGVRVPAGSSVLVVDVTGTRLVVLPLELPEGDR